MKYNIKWLDFCHGLVVSEVSCSNWGAIFLRDLFSNLDLSKVAEMVNSLEHLIWLAIRDLGKSGLV